MNAAPAKAPTGFREKNLALMQDTLSGLGADLAAGKIDAATFEAKAWEEVRAGSAGAFRFSLGRAPTADEAGQLSDLLTAQRGYFDSFLTDINAADDLGFVANRASQYKLAGVQSGALGTLAATGEEVDWELGGSKESCETCLAMAGRHNKAELLAGGILPGSGTVCRSGCNCSLVAVAA